MSPLRATISNGEKVAIVDTNLVCIARIDRSHGVNGEVNLSVFSDDPGRLVGLSPLVTLDGSEHFVIEKITTNKRSVARLRGIDDRNAAERLVGFELYVRRDRLPELDHPEPELDHPEPELDHPELDHDQRFYINDLIGLAAMTPDGQTLGVVANVVNYGAGDILEITLNDGTTAMVTFSHEAVPVITQHCLVVIPDLMV